ncbi:putative transposase for insertion sequence element IS702 [Halomicronema hongdechloris C2206]|uniref:Transposase for insertion sequence element IS702 n=1 Tax=Halomicronema hongdechloris C2206 TaxID=1641165 RepID=A0A1Z3HN99_9CYAN|nr:transposase [Halomicronema hongdechloris]ASC71769.1 putative transposase for insertion sequence element IS702 [Halomicronema hongdechloris C2206]
MKVTYAELRSKPRTLCSLTGLRGSEFEALLPSFGDAWDDFVRETFERAGRKRAVGAGRKAHLKTLEDKLLFILMYFRLYPTQAVQGFLFGMSQAQANQWIHRLTGVLNQALGYQQQLPEREPAKLESILQPCPSLEFMIDGSERRINRPKDQTDRKTYYSGKRQAHSVKNVVVHDRKGKVHYLSDTYEGKKHDKAIADEKDLRFPEGSTLWQDRGFQGFAPAGVTIQPPKKKPRKRSLSTIEKMNNQKHCQHSCGSQTPHWRYQTVSNFGAAVSQLGRPLHR